MRKSVEKQKSMEILSEELTDFRGGNAIQHDLGDILIIGLLCILCNGNTFVDIEMFGELHEDLLRQFLSLGAVSASPTESICRKRRKGSWKNETRQCWLMPDMSWLPQREEWAGLSGAAVIRSKRIRQSTGGESESCRYFLYSDRGMTAERFSAFAAVTLVHREQLALGVGQRVPRGRMPGIYRACRRGPEHTAKALPIPDETGNDVEGLHAQQAFSLCQ